MSDTWQQVSRKLPNGAKEKFVYFKLLAKCTALSWANSSPNYGVYVDDIELVGIPEHDVTYTGSDYMVTAQCSHNPCGFGRTLQLTLDAPKTTTFGDGKSPDATLDGLGAFNANLGLSLPSSGIQYYSGSTMLSAAPTAAGNYTASYTATIDGTDYTLTRDYTIAKAIPTYTAPNPVATIGQTLADVTLTSGWTWNAPSTLLDQLGEQTFAATYNPDPANYNDASTTLTVTVLPVDEQFISIDDQISLTLALNLGTRGKTTDDVDIRFANKDYDAVVTASDVEGVYNFKIEMAPAQIADEIVVTIDGDAEPLVTSVKAYCNEITKQGSPFEGEEYKTLRSLANMILEYGQAANNVFRGGADEIVDLVWQNTLGVENYKDAKFADTTGKVTGASFMALTKPEFRFYTGNNITEAQAAAYNKAGITAKMDGSKPDQLTARFVKKTDNSILLEVTGVSAENMDKTVTVNVTGLGTITFNGNAFAKAMYNNSDTDTKALGAALYNYGYAAKTYFGA